MSNNNTWINNIAVTNPATDAKNRALADNASGSYNVNVVWKNNLAYAGGSTANLVGLDGSNTSVSAALGNLLGVDPKFIAPSLSATVADFRLQASSPAIGNGLATADVDNLNGVARAAAGPVDRGAY